MSRLVCVDRYSRRPSGLTTTSRGWFGKHRSLHRAVAREPPSSLGMQKSFPERGEAASIQ